MNLYLYCSYDGSPVGFKIGRTDVSHSNTNNNLSRDCIDPFIQKCFECGLVQNAFGCIPQTEDNQKKYFILKKKMNAQKEHTQYYINFAIVFECNEATIFQDILNHENDEKTFATSFIESMTREADSIWGYTISLSSLVTLIKSGLKGIVPSTSKRISYILQDDRFYTTLSTPQPIINDLFFDLGINSDSEKLTRLHNDNNLFYIRKKHLASRTMILIVLLAIVILIICIITAITLLV